MLQEIAITLISFVAVMALIACIVRDWLIDMLAEIFVEVDWSRLRKNSPVGKLGITESTLNPFGFVRVNDRPYYAEAESTIGEGQPIKVLRKRKDRLLVVQVRS